VPASPLAGTVQVIDGVDGSFAVGAPAKWPCSITLLPALAWYAHEHQRVATFQSRILHRTALVTCTFAEHGRTAHKRFQCATTWIESGALLV